MCVCVWGGVRVELCSVELGDPAAGLERRWPEEEESHPVVAVVAVLAEPTALETLSGARVGRAE